MSSRTRRRRPRSRSTRRRGSVEVVAMTVAPPIDVEGNNDEPSCIDLTEEDDDVIPVTPDLRDAGLVDLTSPADVPLVLVGVPSVDDTTPPHRRRRPNNRRASSRSLMILSDSDTDDDLPDIDIGGSSRTHQPKVPRISTPAAHPGTSTSEPILSPGERLITCPICLDTDKQIRASGRQLVSIACGHVFCRDCIKAAVNAQKKCPTCRKKATIHQIRPLFI